MITLMHEDEMPANLSSDEYADWYDRSVIFDGVRIGPVIFDTSMRTTYASDQPQVTHHCPECEAHARLVEMMRRREAPYIEQWRRETGRHDALPDYGDMLKWLTEKVEEARWELGKYIAAYAAGAGRETGGRLPIAGLQPWNIDYTPAPSGDQE